MLRLTCFLYSRGLFHSFYCLRYVAFMRNLVSFLYAFVNNKQNEICCRVNKILTLTPVKNWFDEVDSIKVLKSLPAQRPGPRDIGTLSTQRLYSTWVRRLFCIILASIANELTERFILAHYSHQKHFLGEGDEITTKLILVFQGCSSLLLVSAFNYPASSP